MTRRFIHLFYPILFSPLMLWATSKPAQVGPQTKVSSKAPGLAFLKKMDQLIAKSQLDLALLMLEKKLATSPQDLELLMRKARIITIRGDQSPKAKEKLQFYEQAQKISTQIIELYPQSAKGYLRQAVAKGRLILYKGVLESRSLVLSLRSHAQKVLSLQKITDYERGLAHYLLGRAHMELAKKPKVLRIPLGLGWAREAEGGQHLKAAYELAPNSIPFTFDHALWLEKQGQKDQAKKLLMGLERLPVYDPGDVAIKAKAKKRLKKF